MRRTVVTRPVAMPVTMTTIEPAFPDKMELLLPVTAFESVTPEIIIIMNRRKNTLVHLFSSTHSDIILRNIFSYLSPRRRQRIYIFLPLQKARSNNQARIVYAWNHFLKRKICALHHWQGLALQVPQLPIINFCWQKSLLIQSMERHSVCWLSYPVSWIAVIRCLFFKILPPTRKGYPKFQFPFVFKLKRIIFRWRKPKIQLIYLTFTKWSTWRSSDCSGPGFDTYPISIWKGETFSDRILTT